MRYYQIVIDAADSNGQPTIYSSQSNGGNNLGALQVEFDLPIYHFAAATGGAFVRIWGVPVEVIGQANDLNPNFATGLRRQITIYGGMARGLPLATASYSANQQGLLVRGGIIQAFGNWQGTAQTLDMYLVTSDPIPLKGRLVNLTVLWKAGTSLATAIKNTLSVAFPNYTADININPNLILPYDEQAIYGDIVTFAKWLQQRSAAIIGGDYQGVRIVLSQTKFSVYDETKPLTPKTILFQDLIGQPTWYDPNGPTVRTVMRSDIQVSDYVKLPPGPVTSTPQSLAQGRNSPTFQGTYQVDSVRHVGNSRSPDGSAWVTVFHMHPVNTAASTSNAG